MDNVSGHDGEGISVRLLHASDADVLGNVVEDVFDQPVDRALAVEFLGDPRHHLAVALDGETVVGFVSAVDYLHPDKPRELWINEVGVSPAYQGRGIAKALLKLMLDHAHEIDCVEAWVLTDDANGPANALYRSAAGQPHEPAQRMYSFPLSDTSAPSSDAGGCRP